MTFSALDSALLGPLFATEAMTAAFSDAAQLTAMVAAEAALARAEARFGLAADGLSDALLALPPLDARAIGLATGVAGVPTLPFVKAVEAQLDAGIARGFHRGATTQDIMDTATALLCREGLELIREDVRGVMTGLAALARRHRETPCVGRTYGQHAAPLTFGFKAAVWGLGIAEVADALPGVAARALTASLAGPVGTLAGLGDRGPAVAEAFAAELGLGADPLAWHTRRSRVATLGGWLAHLIGALAKMAGDIAHLATTEVGEAAEPLMMGRGGSTAMPHKRNPVGCTVILAAHAAARGHAATLAEAMAAQHERPAGAWHSEWHALPSLFGLASGALREARLLAEGVQVDAARMRANIDLTRGLLFADAAAARLAAVVGREAAHRLVERGAEHARETGLSLTEALAAAPELTGEAARAALAGAFDLAPAVAAAALWTDRGIAAIEASVQRLNETSISPRMPSL